MTHEYPNRLMGHFQVVTGSVKECLQARIQRQDGASHMGIWKGPSQSGEQLGPEPQGDKDLAS